MRVIYLAICGRDLKAEGVFSDLIVAAQARSDGGGFGSFRWRRGRTLTAVRHGRAWRLTGVSVFSSYGDRFLMRFAPTGSQ
jgi:hypothetical protein